MTPGTGRVLGVDPGDRRIGLALSDPSRTFARPLDVVAAGPAFWDALERALVEEGVDLIVVGLPLNMDGTRGPKALQALSLAAEIEKRSGVQVVSWDERLTTVQAEGALRSGGLSSRQRAGRIDKVAAQILLQSYLDRQKNP